MKGLSILTIQASMNQLAVDSGPGWAMFHIETPIGDTLQVTYTMPNKVRAEWLVWSDVKQDWIGVRVAWTSVKHLVPATLFS